MKNPASDPRHYIGDPMRGVSPTNEDIIDEGGDASGGDPESLDGYAIGGGYYLIDGRKVRGKAAAQDALDEYLGVGSGD